MTVHLFIPALSNYKEDSGSGTVLNFFFADEIEKKIADKNLRDLQVHSVGLSTQQIVKNCFNVKLESNDKVIFAGLPEIYDGAASCSTSLFQAADSEQLRNKFRDHAVYLAQPRAFCSNNYGDIVTEDIDKIHPFPFKKVTQEKFRDVYRAFINQGHDKVPEAANSVFSMGDMVDGLGTCADNLIEFIQKLINSK